VIRTGTSRNLVLRPPRPICSLSIPLPPASLPSAAYSSVYALAAALRSWPDPGKFGPPGRICAKFPFACGSLPEQCGSLRITQNMLRSRCKQRKCGAGDKEQIPEQEKRLVTAEFQ